MLKVGMRAPDFSNPDADMNNIELSQFQGKTLVLYFYVRDDCIKHSEFRDKHGISGVAAG